MESDLGYGLNLRESFAKWDQDSLLWRTLPRSGQEKKDDGSEPFSGPWPASGTMLNGIASKLETSVLGIDVSARSSSDGKCWPTPVRQDSIGARNRTANRKPTAKKVNLGDTLTDALWLTEGFGKKLNPAWVEALMGFPPGWLDGQHGVVIPKKRGSRKGTTKKAIQSESISSPPSATP